MNFVLDGGELAAWEQAKAEHELNCPHAGGRNMGAIGGRFTFSFTPTGLGTVIVISCACGFKRDVTDFESW